MFVSFINGVTHVSIILSLSILTKNLPSNSGLFSTSLTSIFIPIVERLVPNVFGSSIQPSAAVIGFSKVKL